MVDFSDGWALEPHFNEEPDMMRSDCYQLGKSVPLDDIHLDAVAFHGRIRICPHKDVAEDNTIDLGEREDGPTTVRELLAAINEWCLKPCGESTNFHKYINWEGAPPLNGIWRIGYDLGALREVFNMDLFYG
ncbi:hypothetical protein WJX74_000634 [Apatococcus lobatus]|uniref:Uncharacterized protein n=2 Tax=Apatococcus TaxID=904362 RepID=A0AAW1T5M0_9CHLO